MKIYFTILTLIFITNITIANTTSTNRRLDDIEHNVKLIENGQLNYKIEKDLLKETYSNNYERINIVITLIIGIFGLIGYASFKSIMNLKKEYEKELKGLKDIQNKFESKTIELDNNKNILEAKLKAIITENEVQNKKIKFIELKEKIRIFIKEDNLIAALEFINTALQIEENEDELLNYKGQIFCRLNQMNNAIEVFTLALKLYPTDKNTILNTVECLYFANEIEKAKLIISDQKTLFENKENKKLLELLHLIELYINKNKEELLSVARSYVSRGNLLVKKKQFSQWNLKEVLYFIHYQEDNEYKNIFQNIIWFFDGQMTGETLLKELEEN